MRNFFIIVLIFSTLQVNAQVGGISASKLATICTQTVPAKKIEFEPSLSFAFAKKYWDSNSNKQIINQDSTLVASGASFRFSYGVAENLEIGAAIPVDMSTINYGIKYQFPYSGKLSFAVLGGFNLPLGNQFYDKKRKFEDNTSQIVTGIVSSLALNGKTSIDFDAQFQKHTKKLETGHKNDLFLNSDIGFYAKEGIQFAFGTNYYASKYENAQNDVQLLSLNAGITIEHAENFIVVLNTPIDVWGKNIEKFIGFGFALTILIE